MNVSSSFPSPPFRNIGVIFHCEPRRLILIHPQILSEENDGVKLMDEIRALNSDDGLVALLGSFEGP
jgi:hypothetical protein